MHIHDALQTLTKEGSGFEVTGLHSFIEKLQEACGILVSDAATPHVRKHLRSEPL